MKRFSVVDVSDINSRVYNLVVWVTVVVMIGMTLAYAGIGLRGI